MALLRDLNRLSMNLKTLWKLNFQTNEQNWKKSLVKCVKRMFNNVLETISSKKLSSGISPENLANLNEQIKLKFEMNLLALYEIFRRKQVLANPPIVDSNDQKKLQKQLDQITDWVTILDKTQERIEAEEVQLI